MIKQIKLKREKTIEALDIELTNKNIPKQTVIENQKIIRSINDLYDTWDELTVIIKERYKTGLGEYGGYDSPMGFLNAECYPTIEASIILASQGYYRPAISLLRCWFEDSLYGIYYNDHRVEFSRSLYEDEPQFWFMLNMSDFLKYLFKFPTFVKFDKELIKKRKKEKEKTLQIWMNNVYMELSAYIHGRGVWRTEILNIDLEEKPRKYNKKNFNYWHTVFWNVSCITTISFILYNPKLLNKYPSKRKKILEILDEDCIEILTKNFGVKY